MTTTPTAKPLSIVLDHVRKPSNLGAVLRVAAGLGARLVLTGSSADRHRRASRFAAVGLEELVPIAVFETLDEAARALRTEGYSLIGTSPRAQKTHWELDVTGPIALVFGNEVGGLSQAKLESLEQVVRIPLAQGVESLNLAVAVGIVGYEVARRGQR